MGVYLSEPNKEKNVVEGKGLTCKYVAAGMQGWRANMEDAHIARPDLVDDLSIFGVFDGHGGKEVAKFVEKHFCEYLLKNENFKIRNIEKALYETFLKMDELLLLPEGKKELNQIKNDSKEEGFGFQADSFAGCTANVAVIYKNELIVANAGDSRCVLSSKGNVVEMSTDHKPDLEIEKNRIIKAGGFVTEGRVNANLNLSRALGDLEYKRNASKGVEEQLIIAVPDIKKRILTKDDEFLLLGCDGIWEMLPTQDLVDFINSKLKDQPLKNIVEQLLEKTIAPDTLNGVGCDNMTAIIVQLNI